MKIYTSYFGNDRNIPPGFIKISIARKSPKGYKGICIKELSPNWNILMEYKNLKDKNKYIQDFNKYLNSLNFEYIKYLLEKHCDKYCNDIVLLCYEKSENFCHRHLVAEWLRNNGLDIKGEL